MLHSMTIRLIQVDQLETLYLCYGVICQSGVIWGHSGQTFDFHLKCNNSSIFHSVFMLLIQMHKLETLNLFWGSKVNLGSFGVIGVIF